MEFQTSVIGLIKERVSTRSYDEKEIDKDSLEKLLAAIEEVNSGMKIRARFLFLSKPEGSVSKEERLGTYGMIGGARSFLVGVIDREEKDAAEFGFQFERIILFASALGIQTCWLGGTFDRAALGKMVALKDKEFIPIVSPAGYRLARPRLRDAVIRATIGADKRKAWDQLFFNGSIDTPLERSQAADFSVCLDMARLAPSASNKQPWRVIRNDAGYHFFLSRTKGYGAVNFDIQMNDIGIAMCHFELAAREKGLTGDWAVEPDTVCPPGWEYVRTWKH